jgi:hypothetical protein
MDGGGTGGTAGMDGGGTSGMDGGGTAGMDGGGTSGVAGTDAGDSGGTAGIDGGDSSIGNDTGTADGDVDATDAPDASSDLVLHLRFDDATGTTAVDSTGNNRNGTLQNGAGWTSGHAAGAVQLSNTPVADAAPAQQYVSIPPNVLSGCSDVTIAMWMNLASVGPFSRLLDLDGTVNGFLFFTPAQMVNGTPRLWFNIFYPAGTGADDQGVSAAYPSDAGALVGVWHHVAFTLAGGTGRLYFDGAEIGSGAMTHRPSDIQLDGDAHAWIGRSTFPVDPYLDAAIDDLRISCRAYTANEISQLAQ